MDRSSVRSFLFLCLVRISSSFPGTPFIVVQVGRMATLPCNWTCAGDAALRSPLSPGPHLQWQTPQETVLELKGSQLYQGTGYEGRANVPRERIPEGDCSLHLMEVRYTDDGLYESFIIVGQSRRKRRNFLQSVQLRVTDHKSSQTLRAGDDFVLNLHTSQAATVIFQGTKDTEGTVKWKQDGETSSQVLVEKGDGVLVFRNLKLSDSGVYKVLDPDGLAISTTLLTVEEAFKEAIIKDETFAARGAEREAHSGGNSMSGFFTTVVVSLLCSASMHFAL
ncbi:uncharacterized protein LOC108935628 [Scleropages formosus]|uniref:Uncharacterized LOC108935628 n=1 Tax=Scleropages formosus TaxID=113540 RepID=A0A8C9S9B0_SCLFO|nr:uncharacterized protein LOC108935628 [Scleropages formosus]